MTTESWTIMPAAMPNASTSTRLIHTHLISIFRHNKILDVSFYSAEPYKHLEHEQANRIVRPSCFATNTRISLPNEREAALRAELEGWASKGDTFDAILSLGTMQHLREPLVFLELLSKLRTQGAPVAIGVAAPTPDGDHLPDGGRHRLSHAKLLAETVMGEATTWIAAHAIEGLVFQRHGHPPANPDIQDTGLASLDPESASCWIGFWGECGLHTPLLSYGPVPTLTRLSELETRLRQAQGETRRLEAALAEERRVSLSLRQKLNVLDVPAESRSVSSVVHISPDSVREIAMEVWFEKQRWGLPYKIMKFFRRWIR